MSQTVSITEARDNFPALVRQVAEKDEAVVVTNRSQPRVVMIRWETYQQQKDLQAEGAEHRLQKLAAQMEQIIAALLEAYQPDSFDLIQGQRDLDALANEAWATCRLLDKPRRHLASILTDGFLNLKECEAIVTYEQLTQVSKSIALLHQLNLTSAVVSQAELSLLEVGFDSVISFGDELVTHYYPIKEDEI